MQGKPKIDSKKSLPSKPDFNLKNCKPNPMKKYIVIVRHSNYEEKYATTNDYKTAVIYALEAVRENKGKVIKIVQ